MCSLPSSLFTAPFLTYTLETLLFVFILVPLYLSYLHLGDFLVSTPCSCYLLYPWRLFLFISHHYSYLAVIFFRVFFFPFFFLFFLFCFFSCSRTNMSWRGPDVAVQPVWQCSQYVACFPVAYQSISVCPHPAAAAAAASAAVAALHS